MLPQREIQSYQMVALGSNLSSAHGTPGETLEIALSLLTSRGCVIRARSRFYRTPAFPPGSGPEFVNAAVMLDMPCDAAVLLEHLHAVEVELGRERKARWGERTVDLDLIAVGDAVLPDVQTHNYWRELPEQTQQTLAPDQLILPHPRLQDRPFVLVPLMDIAPDWQHPVLGLTVKQMHDALPDAARAEVIAL